MGMRITALTTVALVLAACAGDDPEPDFAADAGADETPEETVEPSPTEEPTAAPVATTPTPEPEPLSPGEVLSLSCYQREPGEMDRQDLGEFESFEDAWDAIDEHEDVNCNASFGEDISLLEFTETEEEAMETAGYDDSNSLDILYSKCAEPFLGDNSTQFGGLPWSEGQRDETQGALVLCPEHPDREEVESRMADAAQRDEARDRGEVFGPGSYRVGEEIEPGLYVAESESGFDGCYWERLDSAGNRIENNFIRDGFRAEVYIAETDYSFSSERCGEWERQ